MYLLFNCRLFCLTFEITIDIVIHGIFWIVGKIKKFILSFLLLFSFLCAYNQEYQVSETAAAEKWLYEKFEELYTVLSDAAKDSLNMAIVDKFGSILTDPLAFEYPFDSLHRIGKIYSPDQKFRLITWNVQASDGKNACYGFIQYRGKRNKPCLVCLLNDRSDEIINPETAVLDHDNWYGALYYDILLNRSKGRKLYTLIGYHPHDRYSGRKVIDVLSFGRELHASFGEPVFQTEEGILHRLIYEFAPDIVMRLRYEPVRKMIILDHLSPIKTALEGNYHFYAPDGSYDGFRFRKGMWQYRPDVDVRNP